MADPLWEDVEILCHFDGTDESTTFTDSSSYANTLTANGGACLDTAIKKFGTASLLLDATVETVDISATHAFGTGAWCVEGWVYVDNLDTGFNLFYNDYTEVYVNYLGKLYVTYRDGSSVDHAINGDTVLSEGQWYHVAVSYDGTTVRGFLGGAVECSATTAMVDDTSTEWGINGTFAAGDVVHVDEMRITLGDAVYTAAFAPPSSAFSETGASTTYTPDPILLRLGGVDAYTPWPVYIEISRTSTYTPSPVALGLSGVDNYTPASVVIEICPTQTYTPDPIGIAIAGYLAAAASRQSIKWSRAVVIDGVDVSARVTGEASIEFNEDAANVYSDTLIPVAGAFNPLSYVGKSITVTWVDAGDSTYSSHSVLMFTGTVSDSSWDPDSGLLQIEATSNPQGRVEQMDRSAIQDMIPNGTFSSIVFDDSGDNWQYAQDLLSTTTDSLWIDAAGALRCDSMLAKAIPDRTYSDSAIISGSVNISAASLRDLVNEITITLDFRFDRLRYRATTVRWNGPSDFCTYRARIYPQCERSMVESAANGAGWSVVGEINYTPVWPTGFYGPCGDVWFVAWNHGIDGELYCLGATWRAAKAFRQRLTETHVVTVRCQDSIDAVGRLPRFEEYGVESDYDTSYFDSYDVTTGPPAGSVRLASEDYALDTDDEGAINRAAVEAALAVAINAARGDILRSHRQTRVSYDVPFDPGLSLSQTMTLETAHVEATGKVARLQHRLSSDTGEAVTTIELAVSRHEGTGLSVSTPVAPPEKPEFPDGAAVPSTIVLGQYIGGAGSPEYESVKDQAGYFTNYSYDTNGVPIDPDTDNEFLKKRIYPRQFVVAYPDIEGNHLDPQVGATAAAFDVAVPEDTLICTQ